MEATQQCRLTGIKALQEMFELIAIFDQFDTIFGDQLVCEFIPTCGFWDVSGDPTSNHPPSNNGQVSRKAAFFAKATQDMKIVVNQRHENVSDQILLLAGIEPNAFMEGGVLDHLHN
jgi:hypothetical protein